MPASESRRTGTKKFKIMNAYVRKMKNRPKKQRKRECLSAKTAKQAQIKLRQDHVVYGDPVFIGDYIYFLQCDYSHKCVSLYRYLPDIVLEKLTDLDLDHLNLYNLRIKGDPLYIISEESGEEFRCYYPMEISFPLQNNETVTFIEDDKIYVEAWIEEGWDDENHCPTEEYQYYNKIIIKDFDGNTISEEIGCLNKAVDGNWWIS